MDNIFYLDVDIKTSNYINEPNVTQNDDITFLLNVFNDGMPFDLSSVTTASLASTRSDGVNVVVAGTLLNGNSVSFKLGTTETQLVGRVRAVAQFYDATGRVSTGSFSYSVSKDPTGADYVPSESELTLIETILGDGPLIIQQAITATTDAITATNEAEQTRAATESERLATEQVRIDTDAERLATEAERLAIRTQQTNYESTVDGKITAVETVAGDADLKATAAVNTADAAEVTSTTVRNEFDQVIAEAGSNNPEVVNARGEFVTLKQRLDDTNTQLAETVKLDDTGVLGLNVFDEPTRNILQGQEPGSINAVLGEGNVELINIEAGLRNDLTRLFSNNVRILNTVLNGGPRRYVTDGSATVSTPLSGSEGDIYLVGADLHVPEGSEVSMRFQRRIISGILTTKDSYERFYYVGVYEEGVPQNITGFYGSPSLSIQVKNRLVVNLTTAFGKGNEPSKEQITVFLKTFPDSYFDGEKVIFDVGLFMRLYFKEMKELRLAITALGGSV